MTKYCAIILLSVLTQLSTKVIAQDLTLARTVSLESVWGGHLQCHCSVGASGELHASNPKVNQEETWRLYFVGDPSQHQVALQNWLNHYWLVRRNDVHAGRRITANMIHDPTAEAIWTLVPGTDFQLGPDVVAFRSYDGGYLVGNKAGDDAFHTEPGEVWVLTPGQNGSGPSSDPHWIGWWRLHDTSDLPPCGSNVFTPVFGTGNCNNPSPRVPPPPVATPSAAQYSCANLPPVRVSHDDRLVHAHCQNNDFNGRFYPADDPYALQRVQCDAAQHAWTHHTVIVQACNRSDPLPRPPGCEDLF